MTFSVTLLLLLSIAVGGISSQSVQNPDDENYEGSVRGPALNQSWSIDLPSIQLSIAYTAPEGILQIFNKVQNLGLIISKAGVGFVDLLKGHGVFYKLGKFYELKVEVAKEILNEGAKILDIAGSIAEKVEAALSPVSVFKLLGSLFGQLRTIVKNILTAGAQGIANIASSILGNLGSVANVIVEITKNILSKSKELLDGTVLFRLLHNALYFTSAFTENLISYVKLNADLSWDFYQSSKELLFTVANDGAIIVNNAIVGTMADVKQALAGILPFNFDIGLKVEFSDMTSNQPLPN